jgi:hypothetical protein
MRLRPSFGLIGVALVAGLGLGSGCAAQLDKEPALSVAARFVTDLGQTDGAALSPWFRTRTPVALRRRCPDCPSSRRVVDVVLSLESGGTTLGDSISAGAEADASGAISLLRVGALTCEGTCCRWSTDLLDHGAVHIERACFGTDEEGSFLTRLVVIDG